MKKLLVTIITVSIAALFVCSCGGSKNKKSTKIAGNENSSAANVGAASGANAGAPDWVKGDCVSYFKKRQTKMLCGVGIASGMKDPNMARTAAQARGRTEMGRSIQVQVNSALTDYQSQGTDSTGALKGEQAVESISRQVSDVTLSGTYMTDSWISPDGSFYALMVLEEGEFRSAVENHPDFSEPVRNAVIACMPKLFSAYDDETSMYR